MIEMWKKVPIEDFSELYMVSSKGRVKNIKRNKIKAICLDSDGYPHYLLCAKGKRKTITAHRLVALAFLDNPFNLPCINHKDENKQNNSVENLEWCTVQYNTKYGTGKERSAKSRRKPVIQLKDGVMLSIYESAVMAHKEIGINYSKIRMCCRGERKHAGGYEWKERIEEDD